MQNLINGFYALSAQDKEHYILAIAPDICRVFKNNMDSIPGFCDQIKDDENGQILSTKMRNMLEKID